MSHSGKVPVSRFLANCNGDFRRLNSTERMIYGVSIQCLRRDPGYTLDRYDDVRVICRNVQNMVSTCPYGFSPYHRFLQADANERPFEATPSDFCEGNPRIAGNAGPGFQEVEMCEAFNRYNKRLYGIRESKPRRSKPAQNSEAHADGWHERNMARIEANRRMIAQMQSNSGASNSNMRRSSQDTASSSSSAASSPSVDVDAAINEDRLEDHHRQNTERNREESERQRQIRMEADAERARKEEKRKQEIAAREAAIANLADSKKSARRRGGKRHRKTSVAGSGPDSAAREETRKYESMNAVELHEEELTRLENLRISQMEVRKEALRKAREIGGS